MFYDRTVINNNVIITVELVSATIKEAEQFKKILTDEIENGTRNLIVDMGYCEYMDSTFLGAMVVALKRMLANNGKLKICSLKPQVLAMFELTRMDRVFDLYVSLDKAI